MDRIFKWVSLLGVVISPLAMILLAYSSEWLQALTWAFLGCGHYLNYQYFVMEEKNDSRS